jgi:hypothetical protein
MIGVVGAPVATAVALAITRALDACEVACAGAPTAVAVSSESDSAPLQAVSEGAECQEQRRGTQDNECVSDHAGGNHRRGGGMHTPSTGVRR